VVLNIGRDLGLLRLTRALSSERRNISAIMCARWCSACLRTKRTLAALDSFSNRPGWFVGAREPEKDRRRISDVT
jgi:hypothetical protein